MKAREFSICLESLAAVLKGVECEHAAKHLNALLPILAARPTKKINELCKALANLRAPSSDSGPTTDDAAEVLRHFHALSSMIVKKAFVDDVERLVELLQRMPGASLANFVSTAVEALKALSTPSPAAQIVRQEVIDRAVAELHPVFGDDDAFARVFAHWSKAKAPEVYAKEACAIAKVLTGASVRSGQAAWCKVKAFHDARMLKNAKARAMAGRVAA